MFRPAIKPTMDSISSVMSFFASQKLTIGYASMAIATIGGERIFTLFSFQCPCNSQQNFAYGLTYLLGPAVVLLTIGLVVSTPLWRLYTGCCLNPLKLCPRGNCVNCFCRLFQVLVKALVAPIMWLSVALLNGTFYECAVSGINSKEIVDLFCKNMTSTCQQELARVPCQASNLPAGQTAELLLMLRAQSQILGWSLIITASLVGLIGTCYRNCRSQVSFMQLTFWKIYMNKEREKFDSYAEEYATKLADRNLKSFFENREPEPFTFPNHKAWEEISSVYVYKNSQQCYSTLQRYVEEPRWDYNPEKVPLDREHSMEAS
ncbi:calcium homeostasis modulator protein 5-like [Electrophorus electricus]|uniref:Calcium homeostasis modulator family member 5, tandem duplicate 2 n=1 Tax=Electrophorus electricus TaxID=8005 RepID=A0A4W4F819_ELEEL|nr:calcium homeostasis modulator protein 5-like [Electrophorus electricus]